MKRVRFYDDNKKYLQLHPNLERIVETIWVPRDPILDRHSRPITTGKAYIQYVQSNGGWDLNGSDRDLRNLLVALSDVDEDIILSTGLNETHTRDLERNAARLAAVIFDWDEVLNRREGYRHAHGNHSPVAYMKYAMGTKTRMEQLHSCIDTLVRHNVQVHLATNNTGCGTSDLFESIAHALHPRIVVHCCRKYDSKSDCITIEKMIPKEILTGFGRTRLRCNGMKTFRNVLEN